MQLLCCFWVEDDVYGGVGGADMRRKFDDGLGDVGRAFLLGDKYISRR